MHQAEIDKLIEMAAHLAARDGRDFLVYLLRMALLQNRETEKQSVAN